jgi:hypothetical protein
MRIVLQNYITNLFLRTGEKWTENIQDARPFQHSYEAIDFATFAHLRDLQVVITFPQRSYDIIVPLAEGSRPALRVDKNGTAPTLDPQSHNPS